MRVCSIATSALPCNTPFVSCFTALLFAQFVEVDQWIRWIQLGRAKATTVRRRLRPPSCTGRPCRRSSIAPASRLPVLVRRRQSFFGPALHGRNARLTARPGLLLCRPPSPAGRTLNYDAIRLLEQLVPHRSGGNPETTPLNASATNHHIRN